MFDSVNRIKENSRFVQRIFQVHFESDRKNVKIPEKISNFRGCLGLWSAGIFGLAEVILFLYKRIEEVQRNVY